MELHILLIVMICGAIIALEVKDLLSSIIALGAVGFSLCLSFLILKAPDLAITQLVVEILCLIILIRATIRADLPVSIEPRWIFNTISSIVFVGVFLYFALSALKELPSFGDPIMGIVRKYIDEGINQTGAVNLVTAVILDFRAYDTLGEATVLFASIIGIMAVLRRVGRSQQNDK